MALAKGGQGTPGGDPETCTKRCPLLLQEQSVEVPNPAASLRTWRPSQRTFHPSHPGRHRCHQPIKETRLVMEGAIRIPRLRCKHYFEWRKHRPKIALSPNVSSDI